MTEVTQLTSAYIRELQAMEISEAIAVLGARDRQRDLDRSAKAAKIGTITEGETAEDDSSNPNVPEHRRLRLVRPAPGPNIVQLKGTPTQVLEEALAAGCSKVLVLGIKNDGDNFYKASANCTLQDLAWLSFCADDSLHQMVRMP